MLSQFIPVRPVTSFGPGESSSLLNASQRGSDEVTLILLVTFTPLNEFCHVFKGVL